MAAPLVVFPGALGDFICLVPALRELEARARSRVVLFCKGDLAPLVRAARIGDPLPIEDRRVSWLFSAAPPPEARRFFGAFASIDSFSGAGVAEVESNLGRWHGERGRVHPFRPREPVHLAVHYLRSLAADRTWNAAPDVSFRLDAAVEDRIATLRSPLLVIHPGSGRRSKRWSRAGFTSVAAHWRRRGGSVVVSLGPAEHGEIDVWREHADVISADLDVVGAACLLGGCDAYLGNDSGVSHLAGAVGARGVALFGPTDPQLWRPLSRRILCVRLDPWSACDATASQDDVARVVDALARAGESP